MTDDLPKSEGDLIARVAQAAPGAWVPYHRGFDLGPVPALKNRAWALYAEGTVTLAQKRVGPGDFLYLAIKLKQKPRRR